MTTLLAEPITQHSDPIVSLRTPAWMTAAPLPIHSGSQRVKLAPGIWIVRQRQWWPVSVLDTAESQPPDLDVTPVRRQVPHPAWMSHASCGSHPDGDALFFGVDDENHPALPPTAIESARRLCRACPVVRECLTWALESRHELADGFIVTGEEFGIWGTTTGRQRAKLQKRRKLGARVQDLVAECLPA